MVSLNHPLMVSLNHPLMVSLNHPLMVSLSNHSGDIKTIPETIKNDLA
jgi:hypothetical protein